MVWTYRSEVFSTAGIFGRGRWWVSSVFGRAHVVILEVREAYRAYPRNGSDTPDVGQLEVAGISGASTLLRRLLCPCFSLLIGYILISKNGNRTRMTEYVVWRDFVPHFFFP